MKAVILAAGEGKRLKPFTETMPKVMIPIANKPILEYVFDACKRNKIDELIVVVGYKKEVIMEYFKEYEGIKITYVEQKNQLGTAHALFTTKNHLNDSFIVLSGDNIIDDESIAQLLNEPSEYALLIQEHTEPSKYGVVHIQDNLLTQIIEKPKKETSTFISTGIYKFPLSIFEILEPLQHQGIHALSTVLQTLIDQGISIHTIVAEHWMDIVYPWDIIKVNASMIQRLKNIETKAIIEEGVTIKGSVSIGKNTKIYAGSYIVGPVVIGEGCEIGPNTCIFPATVIGHHSTIKPFCEIRNSIIFDNVHLGSHAVLSQSIIGQGTTIENNFTSISGETTVEGENEYIKLTEIGSMIGEDTTIGSQVVINPGTIIGRACIITSMKHIITKLPSQSKVM